MVHLKSSPCPSQSKACTAFLYYVGSMSSDSIFRFVHEPVYGTNISIQFPMSLSLALVSFQFSLYLLEKDMVAKLVNAYAIIFE